MNRLRHAWQNLITGEDYDAHMASVGQAQANASLVKELFTKRPPPPEAAVLFAGAGTGQIFDFLDACNLLPFRFTFTDINSAYLDQLRTRLASCPDLRLTTSIDDIEATSLHTEFELAVAVLLLEHVEHKKAIASLCRLAHRVFVVIQENPPALATAMSPNRPTFGSMAIFREIDSHLVSREEIRFEFQREGLQQVWSAEREVPDRKKMVGLEFQRLKS